MQLDPKALEAVKREIQRFHQNSCYPEALEVELEVAAKRILQAVQLVPVAWQTEDETRAITRAEYKAIQEADSGRGAYLRILYPKPLYSAPLTATGDKTDD